MGVINDLLFVAGYDDAAGDVGRAYDLATGREVARLNGMTGPIIAASKGRLLTIKQTGFTTPARATVYEPALDAIGSDSARLARVRVACTVPEPLDPQATIERCENAGIRSYLGSPPPSAEIAVALGHYAGALALTYSRYDEAIPILETLNDYPDRTFLLTLARLKTIELSTAAQERNAMGSGKVTRRPDAPGVQRQPLDFGAFSNLLAFDGDRLYVGRWGCSDDIYGSGRQTGVTLDVLNRARFELIKRVDVVDCDNDYQDSIASITLIQGFIVLGLEYRYEADRPNVVVVRDDSLESGGEEPPDHRTASPPRMARHFTIVLYGGRRAECALRSRHRAPRRSGERRGARLPERRGREQRARDRL